LRHDALFWGLVPDGLPVAADQLGFPPGITGPGRRPLGFGDPLGQIEQACGREALALASGHQPIPADPAGKGWSALARMRHRGRSRGPLKLASTASTPSALVPLIRPSTRMDLIARARTSRASLLPITTSSSFSFNTWEAGGLTVS
jgi:hypothetical protein